MQPVLSSRHWPQRPATQKRPLVPWQSESTVHSAHKFPIMGLQCVLGAMVHWSFEVQALRHTPAATSQTVPAAHPWAAVHCTQLPFVAQIGVPMGQLVFPRQATQAAELVLQNGVMLMLPPALQSMLPRQATQ
jgi:hypothetical protein